MKIFLGFLLLTYSFGASAQRTVIDSVNLRRAKITNVGTLVLGGWGLLNLGTGLIGRANSSGEQKRFHQANAIFGGANLVLAGLGYLSNKLNARTYYSASETFRKQSGVEKLYVFNTVLDVGYVVYGLYTRERANRYDGAKADRLKGVGTSLLVQGGFLTILDGTMYLLHAKNGTRLNKLLQNLSFGVGENGFGLAYKL